jgi:hypothetical protein
MSGAIFPLPTCIYAVQTQSVAIFTVIDDELENVR